MQDNLVNKTAFSFGDSNNHSLQLPWKMIGVVLFMYIIFLALGIGRATYDTCTSGYDGLIVVSFVPLGLMIAYAYYFFELDHIFDLDYISCSKEQLQTLSIVLSPLVIIVGILCSLLGIGGGELLGPVLLSMNINPLISSSTVPCFDLMSCIYNIVINAISQQTPTNGNFSGSILLFGFAGSFCGRVGALYINGQFAHPSLLVLFFLLTLAVATIVYIYDFATDDGITHSLSKFCS